MVGEHRLASRRGQGVELQLKVLRSSAYPGVADGSAHGSVLEKLKVEFEEFRSEALEFGEQLRRSAGLGDKAVEVGLRGVPDLGLIVPRQRRVPGLGRVPLLPFVLSTLGPGEFSAL